ncbi:MAG: class II aldolase/adducin family protein, partial [Halieaceae bacterium]
MNEQVNQIVMNADLAEMSESNLAPEVEQLQRKQRLAAALRIFGKFGFDEGVAGHITVRDPIETDTFWVNPMGRSFKLVSVSDLIRVSHDGDIVEGEGLLNGAAFTIHSHI